MTEFMDKLTNDDYPHTMVVNDVDTLLAICVRAKEMGVLITKAEITLNAYKPCDKCGTMFLQPTGNKRIYCTDKCGNAVRQKRIQDRRREAIKLLPKDMAGNLEEAEAFIKEKMGELLALSKAFESLDEGR